MTPQERELLTGFLQQLTQAQAGQKDAEADALIRDAAARQPDALYLLVQRALGLDCALQSAQAQVTTLQAQVDALRPAPQTSFINDPNAWGTPRPGVATARQAGAASSPLAPLSPATLSRAAPAAAASAGSWGGAGLLGTVATTAAGVVAGSFLFQGIQNMMGHHDQTAKDAPVAPTSTLASAEPTLVDDNLNDVFNDSTDYGDAFGSDFDAGDSA